MMMVQRLIWFVVLSSIGSQISLLNTIVSLFFDRYKIRLEVLLLLVLIMLLKHSYVQDNSVSLWCWMDDEEQHSRKSFMDARSQKEVFLAFLPLLCKIVKIKDWWITITKMDASAYSIKSSLLRSGSPQGARIFLLLSSIGSKRTFEWRGRRSRTMTIFRKETRSQVIEHF